MNVNPRNAKFLVADIGGTNVKFGLNLSGQPQPYSRLFPSDVMRTEDPIEHLAAMVGVVIEESGLAPDVLVATVPGYLDIDEDTVLFAGNLLKLNGRKLATELAALLSFPVYLERDSVLALMGESVAGAGRGGNAVLGIYFGTGVGAAFIQDGHPFRGAGWALEIGHIPFGNEGRQLSGLKIDCLETYVSGRALRVIADAHHTPIETIFTVVARDPTTPLAVEVNRFVLDQAMAVGIASALFSPDVLVLGGGVCEMADFPRHQLHDLIESKAPFEQTGRRMDLRWAELGWRAVLHGAPKAVAEHARRQEDKSRTADAIRAVRP
ncbi:ROK family protein [Rhizobium sp. NLR17b]|uniref:ROK family protein n=1 Tax=Rhizobium sp. NLR17b TaxID=2731114 RepID=UPI001C83B20C|nr:ROK family protein [Rhizobium sp. NLR17b]MBX5272704.1 ROK family protein [Rhizobium sp. NLR17b]